jgi:hypothetical protein
MPLNSRDRQILDHVARYRLSTNAIVHAEFFRSNRLDAAMKVTARLVRDGWLHSYPFVGLRSYFVLTLAATRQCGVGEDRALPLGPQALPTDAAVLEYCLAGARKRRRMTPSELAQQFPEWPHALRAAPHALNSQGHLELIRVDHGAPADHVARKCLADITRRLAVPELEERIDAGQLTLVVLTPSSDKAAAIRRSLAAKEFPETLTIHLAVIPELRTYQYEHQYIIMSQMIPATPHPPSAGLMPQFRNHLCPSTTYDRFP